MASSTGDRVRGDELRSERTERARRGRCHVLLGAAAVGDQRIGLQMRRDLLQDRLGLPDRYRDEHDVGLRGSGGCLADDLVDHAQGKRALEVRT